MDIEFNIEQHQMLNLKSQMYTLGIFFRQFVVVVVVMFIRLPLWEKNRRFIRTENMCVSIMCILAGAFLPWVLVIFISENACMFPLQTMSSLHKQKKKKNFIFRFGAHRIQLTSIVFIWCSFTIQIDSIKMSMSIRTERVLFLSKKQ